MSVSKREFYETPYWKEKRYSTVIYQSGKNPADFEFVEQQDIKTFEKQQAVCAVAQCGCIAGGFRCDPEAVPSANTVRIYQGRAYAQSFHNSQEFTGVRVDLPDVLTTFPSLTYEHAVDGNGYFVYDFSAEQSTIPPAGSYRYDLVYLEFWRKEYTPSDDPEMQDAILGETALREKWYYEFHFYEGDNINMNPDIPALSANHFGMRLAVIKRQNTAIVDQESLIDVRPKFSQSINLHGENVVTVGAVGGNYETLLDVISSRTGVNGISPTLTDPAVIVMQPGVYVTPFPFSLGTMEGLRIIGAGIDKTILEFNDLYSLVPTEWIDIGASGGIEFSDMTIRFESTYSAGAKLININGGKVTFRNCKLGEVNTAMDCDGIDIADGIVEFIGCELNSRSSSEPGMNMSGTSIVSINDCLLRQSGFKVINNESLLTGQLYISNSKVYGNAQCLYLNGISDISDCYVIKEEWLSGDTVVAGRILHGLAPVELKSCTFNGPTGSIIEFEDDSIVESCIHNGVLTIDDPGAIRIIGCSLVTAIIAGSSVPEISGCSFRLPTTANAISVEDTSSPMISHCQFFLPTSLSKGINVTAATAIPSVTHCSSFGDIGAKMFGGTTVTVRAGHISGDTALKDAGVTIVNIEQTL